MAARNLMYVFHRSETITVSYVLCLVLSYVQIIRYCVAERLIIWGARKNIDVYQQAPKQEEIILDIHVLDIVLQSAAVMKFFAQAITIVTAVEPQRFVSQQLKTSMA